MTNTIFTKNETKTLMFMISFLRNRGSNQLADRCERVFNNAKMGFLTRQQIATSVIRDAAFRAISLACREKNGVYVRDFSMFVLPHLEKSFILDAEARKLEESLESDRL